MKYLERIRSVFEEAIGPEAAAAVTAQADIIRFPAGTPSPSSALSWPWKRRSTSSCRRWTPRLSSLSRRSTHTSNDVWPDGSRTHDRGSELHLCRSARDALGRGTHQVVRGVRALLFWRRGAARERPRDHAVRHAPGSLRRRSPGNPDPSDRRPRPRLSRRNGAAASGSCVVAPVPRLRSVPGAGRRARRDARRSRPVQLSR